MIYLQFLAFALLINHSTALTPFPLPYNGSYPTNYSYTGTYPSNFIWGLGTAAYQVEGGYNSNGRGATIWDTFSGANTVGMIGSNCTQSPCPINPSMVDKGATGNIADNQYELFNESIQLMKDMGLKNYRFSIAWSRIVPSGRISDGISQEGINYYNAMIDSLLSNGLEPFVTLYHWDLPQDLFFPEKGYYGWYSLDNQSKPNFQMTTYFLDYCDICFKTFGDRVKTWITFNEPLTFCWQGSCAMAPNHPGYQEMSKWPYVAAHNVLHAHGMAVKLYREKYQKQQKGRISMTVNQDWREPKTHLQKDIDAAERSVEFGLGWFSDPLFFGKYPESMRQRVPNLPEFSEEMSQLVKGSIDFYALNHYSTSWAVNGTCGSWCPEDAVLTSTGFLQANSSWLYAVPWGFRKLLNWVRNRYGDTEIIITENGWSEAAATQTEAYNDTLRTQYYANYTSEMLKAITIDKINITGYFGWSIFDNFEWAQGFSQRFGITFINYNWGYDPNSPTNQYQQPQAIQTHTRKKSSYWWQHIFETNQLIDPQYFYDDSFLNTTITLNNSLKASSILWKNQWNDFQKCSDASLKNQLISAGINNFVKSSSVQMIASMAISYFKTYMQQICNDFSIDNEKAFQIINNISQAVSHSNRATWHAFHVLYSNNSSTQTIYFQLLINKLDHDTYAIIVCETKKKFTFDKGVTVLYQQTGIAGQEFSGLQTLIYQSEQQQNLTKSILNYFFIVGIKTEGKAMGLNYSLPSKATNQKFEL